MKNLQIFNENFQRIRTITIRIGQEGYYLDIVQQGGVFCAVCDDGSMENHAMPEFNKQFTEHPDTHIAFGTHIIEHVDKLTDAAKRMHTTIPQLGVVNWDFTINEQGNPVIIEANTRNGSIWLPKWLMALAHLAKRLKKCYNAYVS